MLIFSLGACAQQKKPDTSGGQNKQEEKQPPKELENLRKTVEKIEKSLTSIHDQKNQPLFVQQQTITSKQPQQQQQGMEQPGGGQGGSGGQGGGQGGQSNGQGGQSNGQGGQSGGQGGGQAGAQQKQQPQAMSPEQLRKTLTEQNYMKFDSMKTDIIALNSAWNSYEPKAIAALAPQASITAFENIINNLTKAVGNMDDYQALIEVNGLYKYLPDFYSLYKTDTPPDLDRMKYAVKQIRLVSEKKNFDVANQLIAYMEKVWSDAKPKLKKDNMDSMNKFEFALSDLKNAIASKDGMIIEAKLKVLEGVLDEIGKPASKENQ